MSGFFSPSGFEVSGSAVSWCGVLFAQDFRVSVLGSGFRVSHRRKLMAELNHKSQTPNRKTQTLQPQKGSDYPAPQNPDTEELNPIPEPLNLKNPDPKALNP